MLKILQVRLQPCMNHELPDVQAGFRKGRGTRDQNANNRWIIDYTKAFGYVDHNKMWKIPKEMGILDNLTCLLRNLDAVKKQHLELVMELRTGSKLTKEYVMAVYCHLAYVTYV